MWKATLTTESWNHSQIIKQFDLCMLMPNKCHSLVQGLLLSVRNTHLFYRKRVILRSYDKLGALSQLTWRWSMGQSGVRIPTQWHRSSTWLTLTTFQLLNGNTEFYAYITSMTCHQVRNFLIFDQNIVLCSITLQISKCISRAHLLISVQGCMSPSPPGSTDIGQPLQYRNLLDYQFILHCFFFISRRYLLWYFSHDKIKKLLLKGQITDLLLEMFTGQIFSLDWNNNISSSKVAQIRVRAKLGRTNPNQQQAGPRWKHLNRLQWSQLPCQFTKICKTKT